MCLKNNLKYEEGPFCHSGLGKTSPLVINFTVVTLCNWGKVMNNHIKQFSAAVDGFAAVKGQLTGAASKNGVAPELIDQRVRDTHARLQGRRVVAEALFGN